MRADRDLQGRAVLRAGGGERREPAVDAFAGRAVHPDAVLWGAPDWLREQGYGVNGSGRKRRI